MTDWTINPITQRSNSSDKFEELVAEVRRLILDSSHLLLRGQADSVARLIMAQLTHVHHLEPASPLQSQQEEPVIEGKIINGRHHTQDQLGIWWPTN